MARGKQQQAKKDGQHRAETKEERRIRLQREREAKEKCLKILPFVAAAIMGMMILFALYVRSVPPHQINPKVDLSKGPAPPDFAQMADDSPEITPMLKEALDEAEEAIFDAPKKETEEETMEL